MSTLLVHAANLPHALPSAAEIQSVDTSTRRLPAKLEAGADRMEYPFRADRKH